MQKCLHISKKFCNFATNHGYNTVAMNKRRPPLLWIIILLCSPMAWGGPSYVRHIGGPEGLKDLLVNVIHRDSTGMVWLGTGSSVELFDGIRLTHFPLPGNNEFAQRVTAIVGNSDKQIYVGNGNGLYSLSAPNHKPIAQAQWQTIGENQIIGAISDLYLHNNNLYIATDHGLYTCDISQPLTTTHFPLHPNDLNAANQLRHLCMDDDGVLWMTSPTGLHALLPNQQIAHFHYSDLPEGGFSSICYVHDTLYLGTFHQGVYFFSISNASYGLYKSCLQPISALQAIGNDTLLIATDGSGVQMINRHSLKPLSLKGASFTSQNVYSMLYDAQGLLWVGYYQQGLDYTVYQDHKIHVYKTSDWDSYGKAVRAFVTYDDWKMIGTRNGLYVVNERTGKVRTFSEAELNAQMIFAICAYRKRFYIGTFGGGLYSLSSTGQPTLVNNQIGSQIFCLTADDTGLLWVGSENGVFALNDDKIVYHFDDSNSHLPGGNVYAIFFDNIGRGWFCTQSGMAIYDAEQHSVRTLPNTFPHRQTIRSIYQDKSGTLFFLPDKGHVFAYTSHLRPLSLNIPVSEGLFLTQDAQQRIWIGTTNGLYCFTRESENLTLQDYYDFSSGLPDNIFTLCQPYWDKDSTLWMGHSRGLVYIDTKHRTLNTSHHPRVIDVQQQRGNVSILFSDLRYTLPQYTHYSYRLKGYETDEHIIDGLNECSYSDLPMGKYTFLIRNNYHPSEQYAFPLRVPMSRVDLLILITVILGIIIIILLFLYLRHRLRYHPKKQSEAERLTQNNSYRTFHLSTPQLKSISARFKQTVEQDKMYLNPTLRIAEVAAKIGTSSYSLSYMLNQYMHTNFNDYINRLRIDSFCQRVKKGDAKRYSIDTLAQECGFISRAGFFRNFKKLMGQTPNEYIHQPLDIRH